MANYDSYVICTSPRSGSTLLCKLLAGTKVAGKPESYFHEPSIAKWMAYYDVSPDPKKTETEILKSVFDAAILEGTAGTEIFGLRLQRHSFDFFIRQLAVLHPEFPNDAARFEAAFGRVLFIHLTRADKVAQAVSYLKAQQTGLWHMAPDGTELERLAPPQDPVYDHEAIKFQVAEFNGFDQAWKDWFDQIRIDPIRITYDDLSDDPHQQIRRILSALGSDMAVADRVKPGVKKLSDQTSFEWITRYRAEHRQT